MPNYGLCVYCIAAERIPEIQEEKNNLVYHLLRYDTLYNHSDKPEVNVMIFSQYTFQVFVSSVEFFYIECPYSSLH